MKNTIKSFKEAVEQAFSTNIVNPAVCYSDRRGWFVESMIHSPDHDCICRIAANYYANTGQMSVGGRSDYLMEKSWRRICDINDILIPNDLGMARS